ncbi:hypothetical protein B0H10DRAFT_2227933 [Mycena sp. CBHHK59/15]|nr:hypothetical protein B0H10DRAFT_2227933 [Mycena sp. CBHHK59/15]
MFAPSFTSYPSRYQRGTASPRDRYIAALSRVRQAEAEYAAHLAEERARLLWDERVRTAKTIQQLLLRAASAALSSTSQVCVSDHKLRLQGRTYSDVRKPTSKPNPTIPELQRKNRVRVVRRQEGPADKPLSTMRRALERRVISEPNAEVHATIQRLLSTLSEPADAGNAPSSGANRALVAIRNLERAFCTLSLAFVFPSQLDFSPTHSSLGSGSYTVAKLPFTSRNAPVRQYEHALNRILTQLDSIESQGDTAVRSRRKVVVGMVEKSLEDIDRIVEGRWKLHDTRGREPAQVHSSSKDARPDTISSELPPVIPSSSVGNETLEKQPSGTSSVPSVGSQTAEASDRFPSQDITLPPVTLVDDQTLLPPVASSRWQL